MQDFLSWYSQDQNTWVVHVFLVVLATVVANFIIRRILKRIHIKILATENIWDDAVVIAINLPIRLFVWVIGLSIAAEIIEAVSQNRLFELTGITRKISLIVLIMMFMVRLVKEIEGNFLQQKTNQEIETDAITIRVIARLLRLTIFITTGLIILQTLEISISGVIAFGGIGGIAIGFAAKDLLANFFGGLMIYMDRPFTVGDWIRSPDRDIEGTVEDIGWRLTRIRTFDKRPLYIPNSAFTSIAVENPSRMSNRRIKETFGLRCCDASKVDQIIIAVKDMLKNHKEIDSNSTLIVNLNSLSESSLDFFIYTFTKTTDWVFFHEVKQEILLTVIDIIQQQGADLAFPTTTIDGLESLIKPNV